MAEKEVFQVNTEEIDLKSILQKYLRNWYLFVAGLLMCLGLAFMYLRYSTPEYLISSTVLIKDDKKGADLGGSSMFGDLGMFQSSKSFSNEIEVLRSKDLMHRVLKELSLYASFYKKGNVKTTEIYGQTLPLKLIMGELDSAAFDKIITLYIKNNNSFEIEEDGVEERSLHQFGQEIIKPYGTFTVIAQTGINDEDKIKIKFHDIRKLANRYHKQLKIEPVNKEATVLMLSMAHAVPEKSKDIIGKLIELYSKEAIEDKNQVAASTMEFIDDRLSYLTTELTAVEKDVEEYKRKNQLTNVSSEATLYMERASEYNKQLAEFEIQMDVLNSIESYLKNQNEQLELVPSTLNLQDPTLSGLIARYNELQLERNRMLRNTPANHPLVQNLSDQLNNLRLNILENIRNIQKGIMITRDNLKASSSRFESRIQQVPSIERELLEISRQQGIKEGLYLYLLQKREESALSLAATVANSRMIDVPMAGDEPVKPKRLLIYLLALILGLGIPIGFIYVKDLLSTKVQELSEVKKATNTPVLGEIAKTTGADQIVVTRNSRDPVAEMFRLIRTNLQFATLGKDNRVILITSSMSGEGKSFFCLNLAATLALTGKRTIVLDFDLRKPGLSNDVGLFNGTGITTYLASEANSMEMIKPDEVAQNLFVLRSGPVPPNPAELMLLPKIGDLIEDLKMSFDYVIIDTSPVGLVADALSLTSYVDSSIYLLRYNYTYKEQIKIIDDIYRQQKLRQPMIVANGARIGGNGNGYGYGVYGDLQEKKSWKKKLREKILL